MRTISIFAQAKEYKDGEVVTFRVKKKNVEGHDKMILEEVSNV